MDNSETSAAFSPESLRAAEALARHAALAIENAQLFEREQKTIEELRQAQKRLLQSEKLAAIGQMAAGIAHELNTPLTYIMGNLELLEAQTLTSAQREMLVSISRGSERIKSLAQSLLAFSRPAEEDMTAPAAERGDRARPRAVPLPDREGRGVTSRSTWIPPTPACWGCRTSSRWPSSTSP